MTKVRVLLFRVRLFPEVVQRMPLLVQRALIRGFIVTDHPDREPDFLRDVSGWLKEGKLKYREHVVKGLEGARRDAGLASRRRLPLRP